MDSKIFGEVIKQRRLQIGDSQKELAEKAGLSESTVGAIERGERRLSDENFVKLCLGLGATIDEIFAAGYHAQLAALRDIERRIVGDRGETAAPGDAAGQPSLEQLGELFDSWTAQAREIWISSLKIVRAPAAEPRFRTPPPARDPSPDKPRRARVGRTRRPQ